MRKNELKKEENDVYVGNRLISFYDDEIVPTEIFYNTEYESICIPTPISMMEGDIHEPKNGKYGVYIERIPKLVEELIQAYKNTDYAEMDRARRQIIYEQQNNTAIEMVLETEENLLLMKKQNLTINALFVLLTDIYNQINNYDQKVANTIRELFTKELSPISLYNYCGFDNFKDKTSVFYDFMSHIAIIHTNKLNNKNKINNNYNAQVEKESVNKLLIEYVDRPITLVYARFQEVLSGALVTYCTPEDFINVMATVSFNLIDFQGRMMDMIGQLLSDYNYMDDSFLYQYATYLCKLASQFIR